ncbi:MAG: efflux transporter periplasmic adaptor subunit [Betaproteobacteria bacterium RIFCSPLOWO2_02_FULL_63_19]|nr:MAG: efflux transporter periplasmic adaptor subunit [Betaproteobacteria bacterium RIFCSPLOWO2_02_FULL_63_19]
MKQMARILSTLILLAAALAGGYWWGANRSTPAEHRSAPDKTAAGAGLAVTGGAAATAPAAAPAAGAKRRILYYRNPMGLPGTSPVPKKDPMGMDYIAVYADEDESPAPGAPLVKLSLDKVQKLGVKTEAVALRDLRSTVRAVATAQANERLLHTVTSKFDGWIQKLHVNTTGQAVRMGEPLMDVFSPDLIAAQQEYLIARSGVQTLAGGSEEVQASMRRLADGALQRLRNWDISEPELRRLEQDAKARQYLTLRSPANGVVLDKPSIEGKRFMAGEVLYQIADLSSVWLLAEVFERDLAHVRVGQSVQVKVDAYPEKVFAGKLTFVYPTLNNETRTAKARIELANPQALLKPSMHGRAEFSSIHANEPSLTVPDSAVLDSGTRQLVLVQRGEGKFEPRPVKLGARGDGYVEVLEGVKVGERVVVSANFLIDAESNLKAAFSGFGQGADSAKPDRQVETKPGATAAAVAATHRGEGTVQAMDPAGATITLAHGPIASLKWPAMTMEFKAKDAALLRALKSGQRIVFDMVGEPGGEYTIIRIQPAGAKPAAAAQQGR